MELAVLLLVTPMIPPAGAPPAVVPPSGPGVPVGAPPRPGGWFDIDPPGGVA